MIVMMITTLSLYKEVHGDNYRGKLFMLKINACWKYFSILIFYVAAVACESARERCDKQGRRREKSFKSPLLRCLVQIKIVV